MIDDELDRAIGLVARAIAALSRAKLFEHMADALRTRALNERNDYERNARVAFGNRPDHA